MGELSTNIKMFCLGGVITQTVGYYFASLTVIVMTIIAVERWLHMSRRSLLTVRRVLILYITFTVYLIVFFACYVYLLYYASEISSPFLTFFVFGAAPCFSMTSFAYYKVYRIKYKQTKMPLTSKNTKSMYLQFCISL